jgi:hypothetical protein
MDERDVLDGFLNIVGSFTLVSRTSLDSSLEE